jgi:hypothetical protein
MGNQRSIRFLNYESELKPVLKNFKIGEFILDYLPYYQPRVFKIDVKFQIY